MIRGDVFLGGSFKRQCVVCYVLFPSVTLMGTSLRGRASVRVVPRWRARGAPIDPGDMKNEPLLLFVIETWGIVYAAA